MSTDSAKRALLAAGVDGVSRETLDRLVVFVDLLRRWNTTHNLVGPTALDDIWHRHVADSAQLRIIAPQAIRWLDIGSGAGFPGVVMAILLAETAGARIDLIEASARKAAFLREAIRITAAPAAVHRGRIEDLLPGWEENIDAVSARALAPMARLVVWLGPLLCRGVPAYLHKGLDFAAEWASVPHPERFDLVQHQSRISSGVVVALRAKHADRQSGS